MSDNSLFATMESPLGTILLTGLNDFKEKKASFYLTGIYFGSHQKCFGEKTGIFDAKPFQWVMEQLEEYFLNKRQVFQLPLQMIGSVFQKSVWQALLTIPFGQTKSYGEIAKSLNCPKAARAVGMAIGKNPLGIIVPCHRVIGANGKLTGFASGLAAKQWLLDHEK